VVGDLEPDIFNTPKDRSSLARLSPAGLPTMTLQSAWTAKELGATMSLWSGCGGASNTRRSIWRAYDSVSDVRASIDHYFDFYNSRRPHSSLDGTSSDKEASEPLPAEFHRGRDFGIPGMPEPSTPRV
jgi:transposase InsO family protein